VALHKKLDFADKNEAARESAAYRDVAPELEKLRVTALHKCRDALMTRFVLPSLPPPHQDCEDGGPQACWSSSSPCPSSLQGWGPPWGARRGKPGRTVIFRRSKGREFCHAPFLGKQRKGVWRLFLSERRSSGFGPAQRIALDRFVCQ
jgi:hypothetical protein